MKEREPIDYGYGRCSVVYYQDYMYERNALLSYGIKEEYKDKDFNVVISSSYEKLHALSNGNF